jgi:hypothetical protein
MELAFGRTVATEYYCNVESSNLSWKDPISMPVYIYQRFVKGFHLTNIFPSIHSFDSVCLPLFLYTVQFLYIASALNTPLKQDRLTVSRNIILILTSAYYELLPLLLLLLLLRVGWWEVKSCCGWATGIVGNSEEGERLLLEAVTRRLVKSVTEHTIMCVRVNSKLWLRVACWSVQ